ncbi:MAG: hypothetical protein ACNA8K_11435 [Cyclonatronaceae bacterium]
MKPFDERFADRVRDEFDAYREAVDQAALEQIRRRLRNGRAFVPLFAWKAVAAASILLISAATLWWARPWIQTDPAGMPGSEIAESTAPQHVVDQGLQQRQTVDPNEQQRLTSDPDEQLRLTVPPDQSERIQKVPGVSDQPSENAIHQQMVLAETSDSDLVADQPGRTGKLEQSDEQPAIAVNADQENGERMVEQAETDIRLPQIVFRDLTALTESMTRMDRMNRMIQWDRMTLSDGMNRMIQPDRMALIDRMNRIVQTDRTTLIDRTNKSDRQQPAESISPTARSLPVAVADPLMPEAPRSRDTGSSFGITAGSMVSYTSNQFAGGMGFFAGALQEWQLTESLSLSSGGMLAWNRFDFEPSGERTADQTLAERLATMSADRSDVDLDYDTRSEFSWIALDIPLNMKWDVGGNSRGRYNLTLGLSSLIYLQQRFLDEGTNYTGVVVRDAVTGMYVVDIQGIRYSERENEKAFSRFDLARLMNVAVGYSVRNKRNPLSFELYMKYPLGNLTSREISMGMGGISMRYAIGR